MKLAQIVFMIFGVLLYGQPIPATAQSNPEFVLPVATLGKPYSVNVNAVLRENYQLRVETDSKISILRWTFAGGEKPSGFMIKANGTIVGIPRQPRAEPYRFQLRVIDLTFADSQGLELGFSLTIMTRSVRLTPISTPRLSPMEVKDPSEALRINVQASPVSSILAASKPDTEKVTQTRFSNFGQLQGTNPDTFAIVRAKSAVPTTTERGTESKSYDSRESTADTSSDLKLAKSSSFLRSNNPSPSPTPALKADYVIDMSKELVRGDKIRGPATILIKNVNVLRYDIRIGKDVTFPSAPDLKLPFIPPIPSATPEKPPTKATDVGAAPDPITAKFNDLVETLKTIEKEKADDVNAKIVNAIEAVNLARGSLESLVTASDSILTSGGGPSAIIEEVTRLTASAGEIDKALSQNWPDQKIEELLGRLEILKNDLLTLPTQSLGGNWTTWYEIHKSTYDAMLSRVAELQTQLSSLKSSSTQGTAFKDAQRKLRAWKPILVGVRDGGSAGFDRVIRIGCGFAFETGKETKVKVIKSDRWAEPGATPTEHEVVTVVCSSPLSVSAGFGFSSVDESDFVLVPSTKTVTDANNQTSQVVISRFGFKNKSTLRTLPVLLLNTRVWEPNDTLALHVSTGAAVDVKSGEGGTDLEYIVGPSFSFWRSLFVTPGLHIGRVPRLAGGFQLDQEVPTGISEPPIEKAWKTGFVTTFTYKIR